MGGVLTMEWVALLDGVKHVVGTGINWVLSDLSEGVIPKPIHTVFCTEAIRGKLSKSIIYTST